jgi:sugar lactone lactonase YvrE
MDDVRCVVEAADRLGEGPVWQPIEGRLYWFDIKGRRLEWLAPESGETGRINLPMRASAAAARASGGVFAATEAGLAVLDPTQGRVEVVQPLALEAGFRTNDGKIDPAGDFWWSIMDDDGGKRPGAVFRTNSALETRRMLDDIHIPNTIAVCADGQSLYLADSSLNTLFVHEMADLGVRREFAHTRGLEATPDGSAFDAEGYLWNAQWGGWRMVRYAPDGGIDRIVPMPVEQPTSCAFGGPDLATLYVTSARDGLSAEALARQPLAFEPGVKGLALPLFQA